MKRPAFRPGGTNIPRRVAGRVLPCRSNTNISAAVPGPILDVHRARIFGRCETENGIAPFGRLVEQVMTRPPYNDARRVFWIVDNCSAHRGARAAERLRNLYPSLTLVHAPVHASWLNQIEIYFSIVQRKVLTPNDFPNLNAVAERLLDFQFYWATTARPLQGRGQYAVAGVRH
jgi:hypothetical protein